MKRATIFAVSLAVAAVMAAMWLAGQRPGAEPAVWHGVEVPAAATVSAQFVPESIDRDPDDIESTAAANPVASVPAAGPAPASAGPETAVSLFRELTVASTGSLAASTKGQEFINGFLPDFYVERSRLVEMDKAALRRLQDIALLDPGSLNETIDLTIFPDKPCRFSALQHVSKRDDGSVSLVYAQCENIAISHNASITFSPRNGEVTLLYNDRDKYYQVVSLGDSDFAVVFSLKSSTNNPLTGH